MNMKKLITLIIAVTFTLNSAAQEYVSQVESREDALRPMSLKLCHPVMTIREISAKDIGILEDELEKSTAHAFLKTTYRKIFTELRTVKEPVFLAAYDGEGSLIGFMTAHRRDESTKCRNIGTNLLPLVGERVSQVLSRTENPWVVSSLFIHSDFLYNSHDLQNIVRVLISAFCQIRPETKDGLWIIADAKEPIDALKAYGAEELCYSDGIHYLILDPANLIQNNPLAETISEDSIFSEWLKAQPISAFATEDAIVKIVAAGFPVPEIQRDMKTAEIAADTRPNIAILSFKDWESEDNLTILKASERFPDANAILVNDAEDLSIRIVDGVRYYQVECGFIFQGGKLIYAQFDKPVTMHYAINLNISPEWKEELNNATLPMSGASEAAAFMSDKLLVWRALNWAGIAVPAEPDYAMWHTEGRKMNFVDLIKGFIDKIRQRAIVVKPRWGSSGNGILFIEPTEDEPDQKILRSFNHLWPRILTKFIMQERILPPKLKMMVNGIEYEFDWNLRVFVIRQPDGSYVARIFVRYGESIVNICQAAQVMPIERLLEILDIPQPKKNRFLKEAEALSIEAFKALLNYIDFLKGTARNKVITEDTLFASMEDNQNKGFDMLFDMDDYSGLMNLVGATQTRPRIVGSSPWKDIVTYHSDQQYMRRCMDEGGAFDHEDFSKAVSSALFRDRDDMSRVSVHIEFAFGFLPFVRRIILQTKDGRTELARDLNNNIYNPVALPQNPEFGGIPLDRERLTEIYDIALEETRRIFELGGEMAPELGAIFQSPIDISVDRPTEMDVAGEDLIYNQACSPLVMEVNEHTAGGMWDINQVVGPEQQDEIVIPMYEIAIARANAYKETYAAGLSSLDEIQDEASSATNAKSASAGDSTDISSNLPEELLYVVSRGGSWSLDSFVYWLRENYDGKDIEEIIRGDAFSRLADKIIETLNDGGKRRNQKVEALTDYLREIGITNKPGKKASQIVKTGPSIKIDPRLAIPVTSEVFLISNELILTYSFLRHILTQPVPDGGYDSAFYRKVVSELGQPGKKMAAIAIYPTIDDDAIEGVYAILLKVADAMNSPHYSWLQGNEFSVIAQMKVLFQKGNVLCVLDNVTRVTDDAIRIDLAHEFMHVGIREYINSKHGPTRRKLKQQMRSMLDASIAIIRQLALIFPTYKFILDKNADLATRYDEFIAQMMYPTMADEVTADGVLSHRKGPGETISEERWTMLTMERKDGFCKNFPFLRMLDKGALKRANETLPKLKSLLAMIQGSSGSNTKSASAGIANRIHVPGLLGGLMNIGVYTNWIRTTPENHLFECRAGELVQRPFREYDPSTDLLFYDVVWLENEKGITWVLGVSEIAMGRPEPLHTWVIADNDGSFIKLSLRKRTFLPPQFIDREDDYEELVRFTYRLYEVTNDLLGINDNHTFKARGHEWIDLPVGIPVGSSIAEAQEIRLPVAKASSAGTSAIASSTDSIQMLPGILRDSGEHVRLDDLKSQQDASLTIASSA